jgi:hypothetical protein
MMMEKLAEWMVLVGEIEVLGENLPRRPDKSHLPDPGRRVGKQATPATNRFSYGATIYTYDVYFVNKYFSPFKCYHNFDSPCILVTLLNITLFTQNST